MRHTNVAIMGSSHPAMGVEPSGNQPPQAKDNSQLDASRSFVVAAKNLIEKIPGAFFIYLADDQEEICMANHAVVDLLGCTDLDDFMRYTGGTFRGLVHPDDLQAAEASIANQIGGADEGSDTLEYRIIRKDGQVRWVRDYGQLAEGEYGRAFYVYLYDITDEKNEDERLRQEVARQRMLVSFIERNTEVASSFDLQEGTYQVISCGDEYYEAKSGKIQDIFDNSIHRVIPECRDEYAKNMNVDSIKANLFESNRFAFQAFFRNPDGTVSRKLNTYYAVDNEKRYVLAVREDTTEAYEHEQAIAKAREQAASMAGIRSAYIEDMVNRQGKRPTVLVVEDSEINRAILQEVLSPEFNVLCAGDGEEGISLLSEQSDEVDLVLLDIYMPICNGFEFLERTRGNPQFSSIPMVVASGSNKREDEERCLRLGATDYVAKPYDPESLVARIKGAIRSCASASTMYSIEFDTLTGLYTYQAFLYHAEKQLAKGGLFNVALVDIRDFSIQNRTHGRRLCDETLRLIADRLVKHLPGSIVSRKGGHFFALIPQSQPLRKMEILRHAAILRGIAPIPNVRLRIGLCYDVDSSNSASVACDRAKMAVESLEGDAFEQVAVYDSSLEQRKTKDLKMLADFDEALACHQFVAWVQPKVDSSTGQVVAGEALVRWFDGEGNFVSPGDFIPLFEREGCIKNLDEYIFSLVCSYQKERLALGKRVVPISVNLSRSSLFGGGVAELYGSIADEAGVPRSLAPLEITESAATSDGDIASVCNSFVKAGFSLQMDDFGTGYSSLSSLSELPFDVLKLDKSLIDRIGTSKGSIIIKNAVETAQDLGMSVVAEGVEKQYQVDYLATLDCNLIQGYFYSPPKKMEAFSELLDSEAPYGTQLAKDDSDVLFPSFTKVEFKRFLRLARGIHETVRVLDFKSCQLCLATETGTLEACEGRCFDAWNRDEHCSNCTSREVLETRGSKRKIESLGEKAFVVNSRYLEVEGEPRVVELIDGIDSEAVGKD